MNALLLSGNSLRNKEWIYSVGDTLKPMFDKILIQDYAHWQNGQPLIDLGHEEGELKNKAAELGEHIIFAKSAGAILSAKAIADKILVPKKCVFAGLALGMMKNEQLPLRDWLGSVDCPILFIHNSHDPVGSFAELETFLKAVKALNYKTCELPGETHDYDDLEGLKTLVNEFVFG